MAANTTPIFTDTARSDVAQVSAANTARDGTGTIVTIFTAGADGSWIHDIEIVATGTTTAGVVRLFIHDGSNARLWKEVLVSAITPSTTVEVFRAIFTPRIPKRLPSGYSMRASTHNAETFNIHVTGEDW